MDENIQAISRETLTPLVREALADPAAAVAEWQVAPVQGGQGGAIGCLQGLPFIVLYPRA